MFCTKCGAFISENDTVCPICKSMIIQVHEAKESNENSQTSETNNQSNGWEQYQNAQEQMKIFGFNKYLIWSIITCLCCIPLGIINILLLEFMIKPYLKEGKFDKARKLKPWLVILIVLGFVGSFVINIAPVIITTILTVGSFASIA